MTEIDELRTTLEELGNVQLAIPKKKTSVRTTFALAEDLVGEFRQFCDKLGLSGKEIFDEAPGMDDGIIDVIKTVAHKKKDVASCKVVRKTFVLGQEAFDWLKQTSKTFGVSRDELVSAFITVYLLLSQLLGEKRRVDEVQYVERLEALYKEMLDLERKTNLSRDHPLVRRTIVVDIILYNLLADAEAYLENGEQIPEEWA